MSRTLVPLATDPSVDPTAGLVDFLPHAPVVDHEHPVPNAADLEAARAWTAPPEAELAATLGEALKRSDLDALAAGAKVYAPAAVAQQASMWCPGATIIRADRTGGTMVGSGEYLTWHTIECPYNTDARFWAHYLNRVDSQMTIVFHPCPRNGEPAIVQMLPADAAARGLVNRSGGVQTNRRGRIHVQIEVVAYARRPWTQDLNERGREALRVLLGWLRSLGIPNRWPAGPPPAYPPGRTARSPKAWMEPGIFGHCQAPENEHGDPGAIDVVEVDLDDAPPPWQPPTGWTIAQIQELLNQARAAAIAAGRPWPAAALDVDGKLGPLTEEATRLAQQTANALAAAALEVDGKPGPLTLQAVDRWLSASTPKEITDMTADELRLLIRDEIQSAATAKALFTSHPIMRDPDNPDGPRVSPSHVIEYAAGMHREDQEASS